MTDSSQSFQFEHTDFFVAGAVGEPGQRVFYLQCGEGGEVRALRCEKQHVAILAGHFEALLADRPPATPDPLSRELRQPVTTSWLLGGLAFGYDDERDRIVIVAEERIADDTDSEPAQGRITITRSQATSFLATTAELLAGGRPLCRLCGGPMNIEGHVCPKTNGHSAG